MRPCLPALLTLTLAGGAAAQTRRAPPPGCTASHHTLVALDGDGVDAARAPQLALVGEASLVVWRTRAGALRLAALDAAWRPLGPSREIAAEAGSFALAAGQGGAAILYVERGRELTLARVNARGEAQNVPRLLRRAEGPLREVALTRTDVGWLAAWRDDLRQATALALDGRGLPRGAPSALGAGRGLLLRWLPTQGVAALVHEGGDGDDPSLVSLSAAGDVVARLRWPAATAGPFELPEGLSAAQVTAAGVASLVRVPPGGATLSAPEVGARARYSIVAAAGDGAGVTVVYHDAVAGRTLAARAGDPASAPTPAVVHTGAAAPAAAVSLPDGGAAVVHREAGAHGGARIVATRVSCRR